MYASLRRVGGTGLVLCAAVSSMASRGSMSATDSIVVDQSPLSVGVVGTDYADTLVVVNAPGPVTWAVSAGALPPGISLSAGTGIIAGVPTDTGSFGFDVSASSDSSNGTGHFTIVVAPVPVSVDEVTQALLGEGTLNQAAVEYLDRRGNHNGQLDVGDLRAFLRARGMLPGPTRSRQP